jgi:hypothetical protein
MRDIGALNKEMMAAGVRFFAGGLRPETKAKSLRAQPNGQVLITDRPYLEAKEHVGGFWILEVADLDEALSSARLSSPAGRRSRYARFLRCPPQIEQSTHSSRLRYPQRRIWSGFGTRARSYAGGG